KSSVLAVANAPNPRTSTLVCAPFTPPYNVVNCTPGTCAMISGRVWAGERAISWAVITVVDAPTMPANCLTGVVSWLVGEEVAGEGVGLLGAVFGATRGTP